MWANGRGDRKYKGIAYTEKAPGWADGVYRHKYREKMMELAGEQDVPLLDLAGKSTAYLNQIGEEASKDVYLWAQQL